MNDRKQLDKFVICNKDIENLHVNPIDFNPLTSIKLRRPNQSVDLRPKSP